MFSTTTKCFGVKNCEQGNKYFYSDRTNKFGFKIYLPEKDGFKRMMDFLKSNFKRDPYFKRGNFQIPHLRGIKITCVNHVLSKDRHHHPKMF